jgi:hypothetical protein
MENLLAGFRGDVYRFKEFNRSPEENCIQGFIHGNLYVAIATYNMLSLQHKKIISDAQLVREASGQGRQGERGISPYFSHVCSNPDWRENPNIGQSPGGRPLRRLRISDAFERSVDSACDTHFQTWRSLSLLHTCPLDPSMLS